MQSLREFVGITKIGKEEAGWGGSRNHNISGPRPKECARLQVLAVIGLWEENVIDIRVGETGWNSYNEDKMY